MKYFEVVQNPNETFFVPSKWYHQVKNLDDTVSINHNWFNGCNVEIIAESLLSHHEDVEREIADCRDMENFEEHCQLMLKSSFGMNFTDFLEILVHIADKRIKGLRENVDFKVFDKFSFGDDHMKFDLKAIKHVLTILKENNSVVKFNDIVNLIDSNIEEIEKVL